MDDSRMKAGEGRVVGASVALVAFAMAIVAGLAAGNPAGTVLLRAVVAMIACYPLGLAAAAVWRAAVNAGVARKQVQDQNRTQAETAERGRQAQAA